MKTSAVHKTFTKRSATNRARISNNGDLLPGVDGRSGAARRYRDIVAQIVIDQVGVDLIAEARLQLIRRFSACAVLAGTMEAALANGESIDITQHAQLASSMVRVASRIGINRRAREIVPTLAQYLASKADAAEDEP